MELTPANLDPAFRVTRASHVILTVRDLEASQAFYCGVVGLIVSDADRNTLYLRGIEETAHHSLVLRRSSEPPRCERIGLRVLTCTDLDRAAAALKVLGLSPRFVEQPHQGLTIHVSDPAGLPLELCATMEQKPRMLADLRHHTGAAALRIDHFQCAVPDVKAEQEFYAGIGFRVSDYIQDDASGTLIAAFMYRKSNPHDLVLMRRGGPVFHHFGYIVADAAHIFRGCDMAGHLGFGEQVERGPGRHGLGHALYVYMRDPDGHRVELLLPPIQLIDSEEPPVRWSASNGFAAMAWGLPAPRRWFQETTAFEGVTGALPPADTPMALEDYLARRGTRSDPA